MDGHCQFNKRSNSTHDIFYHIFNIFNFYGFCNFIFGNTRLFYIYKQEVRRTDMSEQTIKEMLKMIDAKIEHIEDISADNRAIIIKLVKQSNQIVKFLKDLDFEIQNVYDSDEQPNFNPNMSEDKLLELKNLFDEFKSKKNDLKEFEEELEKNKDKLTPGQVGES